MQKIEAVRYMDLAVFDFYPSELINDLVAPLIHAIISNVHLGVEYPQETKAFGREILYGYVHYFLVTHRAILQVELIIGKHET